MTEVGLVRKKNEDSICVIPHLAFFAVADGMGGHQAGEVASRMAVESVVRQLGSGGIEQIDKNLVEGVHLANSRVYAASRNNAYYRGMGTTLTAAVVRKKELILVHVGDSRAYIIKGLEIYPLTEDHSVVQEMIRSGGLTRQEARSHPYRNVLTRALGTDPSVEVDLVRANLEKGDILLLCTDGLTGLVEDDEIMRLARSAAGPEEVVKSLVAEALNRGGDDNISVIAVEIDD
jgi:protein phosphatase